jgi:hypothetical protein
MCVATDSAPFGNVSLPMTTMTGSLCQYFRSGKNPLPFLNLYSERKETHIPKRGVYLTCEWSSWEGLRRFRKCALLSCALLFKATLTMQPIHSRGETVSTEPDQFGLPILCSRHLFVTFIPYTNPIV